MKIHLIGSIRHFNSDISIIRTIANTIHANGSLVILNWFESTDDRQRSGNTPETSLDWGDIIDDNLSAITQADALIIEGSRFNYSQGFQTALALEHGKPVLNLYREDLPEYKEWPDKFFVSGISHPLFTSKSYETEEDLERIVTEFLEEHRHRVQELDVKLALKTPMYDKIEQLAHEQGKSKTSVIKDIVLQALEK